MSDANLYAPPMTQVEPETQLGRHDAYRDGAYLLVRNGFVGPKVCVKSGVPVEDDEKPTKVGLSQEFTLRDCFEFKNLIQWLSVVGCYLLLRWLDLQAEMLLVLLVFIFMNPICNFRHKQSIEVFCGLELAMQRWHKKRLKSLLFFSGIVLLSISFFVESGSYLVISSLVVFLINNMINQKALLKSCGKEGDYERFLGAHENFLATLPFAPYEYDPSLDAKG